MAFQNEEDYLDNLLKSITNQENPTVQDLLDADADSNMTMPEAFPQSEEATQPEVAVQEVAVAQPEVVPEILETSVPEVSIEPTDDSVFEQMLFDNPGQEATAPVVDEEASEESLADILGTMEEVNPMATAMSGQLAQSWSEMTVDEVEETESAKSEEELVDDYIRNILENEDEILMKPIEDESEVMPDATSSEAVIEDVAVPEESTQYIDLTDSDTNDAEDLINQLGDIFSDVEEEIQEEQIEEQRKQEEAAKTAKESSEQILDASKIDEELKDLLGMESESEVVENLDEAPVFSEEELSKLAALEEEAAKQSENYQDISEIVDESEDGFDESMSNFLSQVAEMGLDTEETASGDGDAAPIEIDGMDGLPIPVALDDVPEKQGKNAKQDSGKFNIIEKILSLFKKNKKAPVVDPNANENQQVLEELFDENGELVVDQKQKPKKKGLFSKKAGRQIEVEANDDDDDIPDISDAVEKPKKEKKEKKKKEKKPKTPKPKKPKKPKPPKKPKVKKEKKPVDPSELIKVKPKAVLIILLIVGGITGYIYYAINSYSYNLAMNNAVYYMANKKYTAAFNEVTGLECKYEEDKLLKEQVVTVMYVQRYYDAYVRYGKLDRPAQALDALIKGIVAYDEHYARAEELGVATDVDNIKTVIVDEMQVKYGITEAMARVYAQLEDPEQYAYIIESYGGKIQ